MIERPLLSLLIPTYNYAEGLERILNSFDSIPNDIEVIVFDDSTGLDISEIINKYATFIPNLHYRHNFSVLGHPLGAGENWNALIEAASGQYCLLMHHDEMPLSPTLWERLCEVLKSQPKPDIVLMDVVILDKTLRPIRRHIPSWFRWTLLNNVPGYLFRRNLIGPTASLVVRREQYPRFDYSLCWMIDVELYIRLTRAGLYWYHLSGVEIGSVIRDSGSITTTLKDDLNRIDLEERVMLRKKYPNDGMWLGAPFGIPIRTIEWILWNLFRFVELGWYRLMPLNRTSGK
jgi:glycosyltransferase involved in cell wall biosynthesis